MKFIIINQKRIKVQSIKKYEPTGTQIQLANGGPERNFSSKPTFGIKLFYSLHTGKCETIMFSNEKDQKACFN